METTVSGRFDFASRVGVRAVTAGAIVTMAGTSMLLLLAGVVGLFPGGAVTAEAIRGMGGFGIWAIVSWIIASFFGGWLAAIISRSPLRRDGLVHGVVTWAVASLAAGLFAWVRIVVALSLGMVSRDVVEALRGPGLFVGLFTAYLLGLCASLLGGALGARSEARAGRREPTEARRPAGVEPVPTRPPTPQPA